MTSDYLIDRDTAKAWIAYFHSKNEWSVNEYPKDQMVGLTVLSAHMALTFFRALSDLMPDEESRTKMIQSVSDGLVMAVQQSLLFATPPDLSTRKEKTQ